MSAEDDLIDRFVTVFGEPRTDAPDRYLEEYAKALRGWEAEVLALAGDRVIRENVFWPKPAEVLAIARTIAADLEAKRKKPEHRPIEKNEASPEEKARVKELVRLTLMGMARNNVDFTPLQDEVAPNRDEFEAMQRNSPNRFHRGH